MASTRVFRSGNSQAVRIPKEFQFASKDVEIFRRGEEVVLREPVADLSQAFELLTDMSDDFFAAGRVQPSAEKRESR